MALPWTSRHPNGFRASPPGQAALLCGRSIMFTVPRLRSLCRTGGPVTRARTTMRGRERARPAAASALPAQATLPAQAALPALAAPTATAPLPTKAPTRAAAANKTPGPPSNTGKGSHSLRAPVTDENFYFVMADRFSNGDAAQRRGRTGAGSDGLRLRPHPQGLLQRRRPERPAGQDRLHPGARDHVDLADTELQEQGRPARGQLGRLPRLLGHGLHPDRSAPGHQRRTEGTHR